MKKTNAPKILASLVHASGLRFDQFLTRFGTVEYFLLDSAGATIFQGSLGNCIDRACRALGYDFEWLHGQAAGPDWRKAQALNDVVLRSTWGA